MHEAAIWLLGVALIALGAVCVYLYRRLCSMERLFLKAAESLGDPFYE